MTIPACSPAWKNKANFRGLDRLGLMFLVAGLPEYAKQSQFREDRIDLQVTRNRVPAEWANDYSPLRADGTSRATLGRYPVYVDHSTEQIVRNKANLRGREMRNKCFAGKAL